MISDYQPSASCPGDQALAAYVDGRVTSAERADIQRHLADCDDCREAVAEAVRLRPESGSGTVVPFWRRPRVQAAGGGVLALAASLILLVQVRPDLNPFRQRTPYEELVAAVGERRPVEGRLSGFAHALVDSPRRGEGPLRSDYAVLAAAARLQRAAESQRTPETLRALGVARIALSDLDGAIQALERAASDPSAPARVHSDLAAAYLARGRSQPEDLPKALAAADRALSIDPGLREPRFNRALALERMFLRSEAARAWEQYLQVDPSGPWADEARDHLRALGSRRQEGAGSVAGIADRVVQQCDGSELAALEPQALRDALHDDLLSRWAKAFRDADQTAPALLAACRCAATAIAGGGDRSELDAVDVLERLAASDRAAALIAAEGHERYAEGRALLGANRMGESGAHFAAAHARLSTAGSPFSAWARAQWAYSLFFQGDHVTAAQAAASLAEDAARRGYLAVAARAHLVRGMVHYAAGEYYHCAERHRRALELYTRLGDRENTSALHQALAEPLRMLGERRDSWRHYWLALGALRPEAPARRYNTLLNSAAKLALSEGWPSVADALLEESLTINRRENLAPGMAESHMNRARVRAAVDDVDGAMDDVHSAQAWLARVPDPFIGRRIEPEILATQGEALRARRPAEAIAAITASIDKFSAVGSLFRTAQLLQLRGRTRLSQDDAAGAEADFAAAIGVLEDQRARIAAGHFRVSYIDEVWDAYGDWLRLQLLAGRADAAFARLDQWRGRSLQERFAAEPVTVASAGRHMPATVAVVHYATLQDRTVIWVTTASRQGHVESGVGVGPLQTQVEEWIGSIERRDRGAFEASAAALHRILFAPAADLLRHAATLIVVPDGPLWRVPFGALFDPETRRFVLEDFRIAIAPTGRLPFDVRSMAPIAGRAMVVANPMVTGGAFPPLPDAEVESKHAAAAFAEAGVLVRAEATKQAFVRQVPSSVHVHFAGHAVANDAYPHLSRLVFAGDGQSPDSVLLAGEIEGLPLRSVRLVVLAACRSGIGQMRRGEGSLNLARPFLHAGARYVLGALWDVADRETEALFESFYRAYARTAEPIDALRQAQLAALHEYRLGSRGPAAWASFAVYTRVLPRPS